MKARVHSLLPLLILCSVVASMLGLHGAGLFLNLSPSLPMGLYRAVDRPVSVGELVSLCLSESLAEEGMALGVLRSGPCPGGAAPLLKAVAAAEGDQVEIREEGVFINGSLQQGPGPTETRSGKLLQLLAPSARVLGPGQLWLSAPHPRSWDSRYFGSVDQSSVRAVLEPVWTVEPLP